jgi:hypothetical protein
MITFLEVKQSPTVPKEEPMKDFELAVSELIDQYRNKSSKDGAVGALRAQADLVYRDEGWTKSSADQPDPEPAAAPAEEAEDEEETETKTSKKKK